jgi:ATP-binding cassette subfamily F protein uup
MVLLNAENLSKSYGPHQLFDDVDLAIEEGDKIGLVGHNGAGKSTLLRIVAECEEPDAGTVTTAQGLRRESLSQRPDLSGGLTALQQVLVDGPPEFEVVRAYEEASTRLEEGEADDNELVERVSELANEMDRVDGWSLENDAKATLNRLGIDQPAMPITNMSGGQKRRVALARALIRPSDLLLLDEPTNHLDVETIEWLEEYLTARTGALLMVTHDRYFLERICDVIVEIDQKTLFRYEGNYETYLRKREERYEQMRQKEQKRQQLAKQEREWLQRSPQARTTKNKARVDRAEELLDTDYSPDERGDIEIDTVETRLGDKTVFLEGVSKSRGGELLVEDFSYRFDRDERVGIIGPNGVGKSTLLELIAGRLDPDDGEIERGQTVVFGYYDQESMGLNPDQRVHDYITDISNKVKTEDGELSATEMLEKFLFDRDRQWEQISTLSGGEKRRLYLLGILMDSPNFLLLDEPTNDLDLDTLNILEDYIESFGGAVLVVSHDRHFLDRTVDHLLVFEGDGEIERFPGAYTPWLEEKKKQQKLERQQQRQARESTNTDDETDSSSNGQSSKGLSYREREELQELEGRIEEIEARLSEIEDDMVEEAQDHEAVRRLDNEKQSLETELTEAMVRWEELAERVSE